MRREVAPHVRLRHSSGGPPMRIGMIAPPWFPLPPQRYGGIEFVVSLLTEGLVARGHDVTLFASGDSETRASLSYIFARAPYEQMENGHHLEVMHSLEAYTRASEFDVIHDHDGLASRAMGALVRRLVGAPVVATLHGPADPVTRRRWVPPGRPQVHRHQRLPASRVPRPRVRRHHPQRDRRGTHAVHRREGRLSPVHRAHDSRQGRPHRHRRRQAGGSAAHHGRQGQRGAGARLLRRPGRAASLRERLLPR